MSTMVIGNTEYEVTEELLDQCQLLYYVENPRVYSILRANGTTPTQKEIEEKMTSMEHVKQLKLSIAQNGGLIDPLIVVERDGDMVVLEGNSRLAAYRLLAEKDPLKWQKVRALILPPHITEGDKDGDNPISQLYAYVQKLRSNTARDRDGRLIRVGTKTKFYLYAVCDVTSTLENILETYNFTQTPDKLGYYNYNSNLNAYIEVLSYDKIILDAQKRNKILFDKLGI